VAAERLLQKTVPYDDAAAHLLFQLDGNLPQAVDAEMETVADVCLRHGARDALVAKDRPTRDRLWEARRKIMDAINNESPVNHKEDVVVPRATIHLLLKGMRELAQRYGVRIISFGHAGDGNVHVNVLRDSLPDERWQAVVPVVTQEIFRLALSLGGTLTGEHGIGVTRRSYLPLALDATQIALMRQIRDVFDPNHILNPGKIFP
jgi:glycolate oxidase